MKIVPSDIISSIRDSLSPNFQMQKFAEETPPFRSELFSSEQMEEFGKVLATRHKVLEGRAFNTLLKRLAENEELLLEVHSILTESVRNNKRIIPAGEWLLDNFYLIQEQIRTGKKHLPKAYNENLPRILNDHQENIPRVYDIAINIISHSDGRVSIKNLESFLHSYQAVTPLKMGELWAIPIMLRLALIENLRRLSTQIASDRINQNLADYWAGQMIRIAENDPKSLILVIADMARSKPPLVSSFVAELTRQLQGKGPSLALTLNWIEQVLTETGQSSDELIHFEIQKQAADQVSMSNSIGSLRFLGTMNWQDFVESQSIVEQNLRKEQSGIYSKMDFETRDHYRHSIEKFAKVSGHLESFVADLAVDLAQIGNQIFGENDRKSHVGYYLIGKGVNQLKKAILPRKSLPEEVWGYWSEKPLFLYLGSIILFTLGLSYFLISRAFFMGTGIKGLWVVTFLCLICTSHLAITLINWLVTQFIKPEVLPRMDYTRGIDPQYSTLVIIPCMITGIKTIETLVETLLVHYLANKDPHIYFGLLTDFSDSTQEVELEDSFLIDFTLGKIEELNAQYDTDHTGKFYWFHRPRNWNAGENVWMGFERKRGKLTELNDLLRGEAIHSFSHISGDQRIFSTIQFIITLDSDTQLPRDSARKMIASMAHPLNRARIDPKKRRVTEGYGILQPRLALSLTGSSNSLFARMQGNDLGIDPYSKSTSDVYQDLFHEGSFIGKGIYDVDIFRKGLNDIFPTNRILSHDLLEGCYTRSGLLSDVQLYEEYPSRYQDDVKRRYRWIRGDWQIAAWVLPWIPKLGKGIATNPLSALSKWKVFDNLRRSLVAPSIMFLLISGWTILHDAWFWTLTISIILIFPSLVKATKDLLFKPKEIVLKQHFNDSINPIMDDILQNIFLITCLPYEAYYSLKAILVTLYRLLISRKNLLEWSASSSRPQKIKETVVTYYSTMAIAPALGILSMVYLSFFSPFDHFVADPVLIFWIICPFIAWYLSRPTVIHPINLSAGQIKYLRKIARKTWAYFETFATEHDNWLSPDNYQEHPMGKLAHRTSPTNIGMGLLSTLAATDFGYLTLSQFYERIFKTFETMKKMERFKGHFYNWYDTQTLLPLNPRYISTVDSGNLTGHLITLRNGILQKVDEPILSLKLFLGLRDTLNIFRESHETRTDFKSFERTLDIILDFGIKNISSLRKPVDYLVTLAENLYSVHEIDPYSLQNIGSKGLLSQCVQIQKEINHFFPELNKERIPEIFQGLWALSHEFSIREMAQLPQKCSEIHHSLKTISGIEMEDELVNPFLDSILPFGLRAQEQLDNLQKLEISCLELSHTEFDFLYDSAQALFSIGFDVDEHRLDPGFYDLLASESRLATFIAISQDKIPQDSWFSLGRQLTNAGGVSILLSWSGSMFEYLMPLLIMPTYHNTILDQTYHSMVQRQIEYGRQLGVPWGISESGYNLVDTQLNYQYRAFGVPELGLKRGLADDLVISPYATTMALMVDPKEAYKNLEVLSGLEMEGAFGFYEAIDYTPSRLPRGQNSVIIRSYMAHHQGMSLLALDYFLLDKPMQKRFELEPQFQASVLLLQERIPKSIKFFSPPPDVANISTEVENTVMRVIKGNEGLAPEIQLLSNGNYHVMMTGAGSGYSRWKNIALTRWREDSTRDNWGAFCYIRDLEKGSYFSAGYQPSLKDSISYEAVFSQGRAEFKRQDLDFETHMEVVVSPEDDVEIRRIRITNRSRKPKLLELTTYAEVVLASSISDALHPAFSNLFVETEILDTKNAILCNRRPRTEEEKNIWFFHLLKVNAKDIQKISYETDRMQFIGRAHNLESPLVMSHLGALSGTEGPVLDPIVSIQNRIKLNPQETVTFDCIYGVGENRTQAENLINKYQDPSFIERSFELAWTHNQVVLRQINAQDSDAQLYEKLAGSIIFANLSLRADPAIIMANQRGQSGLWGYSISGDLPIVLVRITDQENIDLVKQMVQAHAYWRLKGLVVDLVIWNEEHSGYRQVLQNQIIALTSDGIDKEAIEKPGGIFVRVVEQIAQEDRILIQSVARIEISDLKGTLSYQAGKKIIIKNPVPPLVPSPLLIPKIHNSISVPPLTQENGYGGFTPDGREYIIHFGSEKLTPLPWVNVLANANFGTVISESGSSYTWALNAHEFRLSPWENDSVQDSSGEAFYIRDEESGDYWSPSFLPCKSNSNYVTHHGFGYSTFEHTEDGIYSEMKVFIDLSENIKYRVIKLKNNSSRPRKISVTGYVEWVLGDLRSKTAMHIVTEIDAETGSLFVRNSYNKEFNDHRISFFDVNDAARSYTGDRTEFIGRNRSLSKPEVMGKTRLSGKVGAALDPCGALQTSFYLSENEEHEVIFLLGTTGNAELARNLIVKTKAKGEASKGLELVNEFWNKTLGQPKIQSPDMGMNLIGNGWLMYQTLACRFWARSGYSQSGGAIGFRDQLQDSLAIIAINPELVREHILLCASRQFKEGDVQHWWHPPGGRGVRTRCSDDFLWLVLATCRYVRFTGDESILLQPVYFIEGRLLNADEESYYDQVTISHLSSSLYDHCIRALKNGLKLGIHQLPLMGSGDWNDGMDKVGIAGKGESVWLGFFLYDLLMDFSELSQRLKDEPFSDFCLSEAGKIQVNIEKFAWDGEWYKRAFYDDGTPLGSKDSVDCKIDSLSQSWSVLSGAANAQHSKMAMDSVYKHLVKKDLGLIQLLDPPFDKGPKNPGYIKGYVPGIRENGGQYTHAAIWMVMAFAKMKNREKAWELFSMINPVNHGNTSEKIALYKVEPYVVAADIYKDPLHPGRGGWTWYTGSAGWMYRLITESLLGLIREGDYLILDPCIPSKLGNFRVEYRFQDSLYVLHYILDSTPFESLLDARNASRTIPYVRYNGQLMEKERVLLTNNRTENNVEIILATEPILNPENIGNFQIS